MAPVCGAFRGRVTAGRNDSGDPATSMQQSTKAAIHEMACSFILTDFKPGFITGRRWQINYHPQSGWYDESPRRGLLSKPGQSHLLLTLLLPLLVPNVLPDHMLL